jgi:hypothetical protein
LLGPHFLQQQRPPQFPLAGISKFWASFPWPTKHWAKSADTSLALVPVAQPTREAGTELTPPTPLKILQTSESHGWARCPEGYMEWAEQPVSRLTI